MATDVTMRKVAERNQARVLRSGEVLLEVRCRGRQVWSLASGGRDRVNEARASGKMEVVVIVG